MIRRMLALVGLIVFAAFAAEPALAQFYKGKTVTMIVNYPPGGPTDIEGRIIAQHLPGHIAGNPTIVVKNVGGAGGVIGTNQLAFARIGLSETSPEMPNLLHALFQGRIVELRPKKIVIFQFLFGSHTSAGGVIREGQ